jgi:hypothetical protein
VRPKQTTLAGSNYRAMPLKEQVEKATDRLRPVAGGDEVSTSEREDFLRPIFSQIGRRRLGRDAPSFKSVRGAFRA